MLQHQDSRPRKRQELGLICNKIKFTKIIYILPIYILAIFENFFSCKSVKLGYTPVFSKKWRYMVLHRINYYVGFMLINSM